ncbi:MAG: hypothetical protein EA384_08910, partial [Spirochaetaceae bacterium]
VSYLDSRAALDGHHPGYLQKVALYQFARHGAGPPPAELEESEHIDAYLEANPEVVAELDAIGNRLLQLFVDHQVPLDVREIFNWAEELEEFIDGVDPLLWPQDGMYHLFGGPAHAIEVLAALQARKKGIQSQGLASWTRAVGFGGLPWPNREVGYYICSGGHSDFVIQEMERFGRATGITFREVKRRSVLRWAAGLTYMLRITITHDVPGGVASIGSGTAWRFMKLNEAAMFNGKWYGHDGSARLVQHEVGHVVGLQHEHQRPDRDDHISIDCSQLDDSLSTRFNYGKIPSRFVNTFDTDYDHESVMHYRRGFITHTDGTEHKAWTDNKKNYGSENEQSFLTPTDIYTVNRLYDTEFIMPPDDPGPQLLSFDIDGQGYSFSHPAAGYIVSNDETCVVGGDLINLVHIRFPGKTTGVFTDPTPPGATAPYIGILLDGEKYYLWADRDDSWFSIVVTSYGAIHERIEGTFEGQLVSLLGGDSIEVSNGMFSLTRYQ